MKKNTLSIIIVNYNTCSYLIKCLNSIFEHINNIDFEVIVVDSNSNERNIEELTSVFTRVMFLFLDHNKGFGYGCNYGAKFAKGKYLAFLNPDIILTENIMPDFLRKMNENSMIGVCGPMLYSEDGTYQCSTGFRMGFWQEFLEAFMLINIYRKVEYLLRDKYRYAEPISIGWISGAFMIMRKGMFDVENGFDETFFLNYEDIDLCSRISNAGFVNYYFPYLKCTHSGLSSQGKNYEELVMNRYSSRLLFGWKHYSKQIRFVIRLLHIIGLALRRFVMLFSSKSQENLQRQLGYKNSMSLYLKEHV